MRVPIFATVLLMSLISCEPKSPNDNERLIFINSLSLILLYQHNGEVDINEVAKAYDFLERTTGLKSNVQRDVPFIYLDQKELVDDIYKWIEWYKKNQKTQLTYPKDSIPKLIIDLPLRQ